MTSNGLVNDYIAWHSARSELERLRQTAVLDPAEIELLAHQLSELESAALPPEAVTWNWKRSNVASAGAMNFPQHWSPVISFCPEETLAEFRQQWRHRGTTPGHQLELSERSAMMTRGLLMPPSMLREAAINCEEAQQQNIQKIISDVDLSPERLEQKSSASSAIFTTSHRKHRVALEELLQAREAPGRANRNIPGHSNRNWHCMRGSRATEALQAFRESSRALSHQRRVKRAAMYWMKPSLPCHAKVYPWKAVPSKPGFDHEPDGEPGVQWQRSNHPVGKWDTLALSSGPAWQGCFRW